VPLRSQLICRTQYRTTFLGACLAELARLLSLAHCAAAGAANRPHLLIFEFEKELTMKTDMPPYGVTELTPEKGDPNFEGGL
jgi:hypothetical protein